MRHVGRLLLMIAALAVAGFVLVAVGQASNGDEPPAPSGWYANAPDEVDPAVDPSGRAYSSTLSIDFDDEPGPSNITLAGFGLVGLSFLLTAGTMGFWMFTRRSGPHH